MRELVFLICMACGAQQAPTQTQTQTQTQLAPSQTLSPIPAPAGCKSNDDCAMSITRSCCSPCGLPPFADLKSEVDSLRSKCAEIECSKREPQECKPTESIDAYHAECVNAACVAVRNPPAELTSSAKCTQDSDCIVGSFECCSSCSSAPYVTSARDQHSRIDACANSPCANRGREQCPTVASPSLYRAACRAGTCAGIKR